MLTATSISKPEFIIPCPPLGAARVRVCCKKTWDIITVICKGCGSPLQIKEAVNEIAPEINAELLGITCGMAFLKQYRDTLEEYMSRNKDYFGFPEKLDFEAMNEEKCRLPVMTYAENLVHQHTGLNFIEIQELDILDYRMLFADAVKLRILSRPDGKGKQYLNDCYDYMHYED